MDTVADVVKDVQDFDVKAEIAKIHGRIDKVEHSKTATTFLHVSKGIATKIREYPVASFYIGIAIGVFGIYESHKCFSYPF